MPVNLEYQYNERSAISYLGCGINMDVVLGSVSEEIDTALELLEELRVSPWSNGLDSGIKGNGAHLKSDLIVSLACCSVRDILSSLGLGNSDLSLRDQRTSD